MLMTEITLIRKERKEIAMELPTRRDADRLTTPGRYREFSMVAPNGVSPELIQEGM